MAEGVKLVDGVATTMGDGVVVVMQKDERGVVQNVVLSRPDLEKLLAVS